MTFRSEMSFRVVVEAKWNLPALNHHHHPPHRH
jgi:hypothetical protein